MPLSVSPCTTYTERECVRPFVFWKIVGGFETRSAQPNISSSLEAKLDDPFSLGCLVGVWY